MKLLVTIIDRRRSDQFLAVLRRCAIAGYSVIPGVVGAGASGLHLGTRAFPGENVMVLTLVSKLEFQGLKGEFDRFRSTLAADEAFKVLALDAEALD